MTTVSLTATGGETLQLTAAQTQVILTTEAGGDRILFGPNDTELQFRGAGQGNLYLGGAGADLISASGTGIVFGAFADIETLVGNGAADWTLSTPGSWTVSGVAALHGAPDGQHVLLGGGNTLTIDGIETLAGSGSPERVSLLPASGLSGATMTVAGIDTLTGSAATERVTLSGGAQTLTVSALDTLVGSEHDNAVTMAAAQTGGMVNLLGGYDELRLADGRNILSAYNIDSLAGGTGDLTRRFAKRVGPTGEVILADINASMLRVGRDKLHLLPAMWGSSWGPDYARYWLRPFSALLVEPLAATPQRFHHRRGTGPPWSRPGRPL